MCRDWPRRARARRHHHMRSSRKRARERELEHECVTGSSTNASSRWVVLLRGINVGGRNSLPMKSLISTLEAAGCTNVSTYIQSGNVVLQRAASDASEVAAVVRRAILDGHGMLPVVMVLSSFDLRAIATANPYHDLAVADPKSVHVYFLDAAPTSPDLDLLAKQKTASESFSLVGRALYLHTPDGLGRSKLAAVAEKAVGVAATARNANSLNKLLEMTSTPPCDADCP